MYTSTILAGLVAASASVSALPSTLARRADCSTNPFPWFVSPQADTTCSTQGTPSAASGPAPGRNATCESLQGSWGAVSASIAGAACGNPYQLTFYTTPDCTDAGVLTTQETNCIGAPEGAQFVAFSAVHL